MKTDMAQYKDLFVETSRQYLAELNDSLLHIEKQADDKEAIDAVFRAAHSLKGQSAAMGYEETGYLCHVFEDVFYQIKQGTKTVTGELVDDLFGALDALNDSIAHIESEGTELAVGKTADRLKKMVGVDTVGAGKSVRAEPAGSAAPPTAEKTAQSDEQVMPPTDHGRPAGDPGGLHGSYHKIMHIKSIPIRVGQLDEMVGTLEEMMIHRLTMQRLVKKFDDPELVQTQDKIDSLIDVLQYQIMQIRTVPLSLVLDHFPRAVRDLARMLHKSIDIKIEGADLELDRTIVEKLDEPLTHIIRNAADHGIEEHGTITISARSEQDYALVSVSDDGSGIDWQKVAEKSGVDPGDPTALQKALFSGISTASQVSLVSGRGVGLEVVARTIEDLGGSITVTSEKGKGTTFSLKLPLTVSIGRSLIVRIADHYYALAAQAVDTSVKLTDFEVGTTAGQEAFRYEEEEVPLLRLHKVFDLQNGEEPADYAVIIVTENGRVALAVNEIHETLEAVIKPLPELLKRSKLFSGVTLIGDGRSALIINPRKLLA